MNELTDLNEARNEGSDGGDEVQSNTEVARQLIRNATTMMKRAEELLSGRSGDTEFEERDELKKLLRENDYAHRTKAEYAARRIRDKVFDDPSLFGEPGWDILLDMYASQSSGRPVSISNACIASSVPHTTALRWISLLIDKGFLYRIDDAKDARRSHLFMTSKCRDMMTLYIKKTKSRGLL